MEEEDSSPLLAHEDDDVDGEGVNEPKKKLEFQDPVLEAIGEFGPYQVIIRPGVAGAVLQTPLSFID